MNKEYTKVEIQKNDGYIDKSEIRQMRRNAKFISIFFYFMIGIISMRIVLFIVYDVSQYINHNDGTKESGDSFAQVILINLTEIFLVITVTQSLKWSIITNQQYDKTRDERRNSSIDND